jgi:hypothetical protein
MQSFPHINRQRPAFKANLNTKLIFKYLTLLKTNKTGNIGRHFNSGTCQFIMACEMLNTISF